MTKITFDQLREMVSAAVKAKLAENADSFLTEGAKEIPVRMVLGDIKDVVVGSIVEDLMRELKMDEAAISQVVSRAFDNMTKEIVLGLDVPGMETGPVQRRRVVGF